MNIDNVNMITINRGTHNYIEDTVASLFASDWATTSTGTLNIFVGSADESHLQNLVGHDRVRIIHFDPDANTDCTPEQLDLIRFRQTLTRPGDKRRNCGVNKTTAVGFGPGLFCEDDVRFDPTWCAKLAEVDTAMTGSTGYVLNLAKGMVLCRAALLVGSQAVYFSSPELQAKIALAMRQYYEAGRPTVCSDVLLGQRAIAFSQLWQKHLVTHIGAYSTFATADVTTTNPIPTAPVTPGAPAP